MYLSLSRKPVFSFLSGRPTYIKHERCDFKEVNKFDVKEQTSFGLEGCAPELRSHRYSGTVDTDPLAVGAENFKVRKLSTC